MLGLMAFRLPRYGPASRRPHAERPGNLPFIHANCRRSSDTKSRSADPFGRDEKSARLEAALVLADEPLPSRRIAEVVGLKDGHEARRLVEQLRDRLAADGAAFRIEELAGGYQLLTTPECLQWLLRLRRAGHDVRLTPAVLETLAMVAYKQPITKADVETVRGVGCGEQIRLLMEKGLVRIGGRHDSLGRPQLYVTTKRFLQVYGLNTLDDLPEVESLKRPG
jgi:segregation and condensation protein B